VDLAESLCLLMDLETAAPELLTTALDRLDLPADRRQEVAPLMEARLRGADTAAAPGASAPDAGIDRHVSRLIRVTPSAGKSFSDCRLDLSIDDQTTAAPAGSGRSHHRQRRSRTSCLLSASSESRALTLFFRLRRSIRRSPRSNARRGSRTWRWAGHYSRLGDTLRLSRPMSPTRSLNALWRSARPTRPGLRRCQMPARGRLRTSSMAFGAVYAPVRGLVDARDTRQGACAVR
jgi:hypothetical protein